MNKVNSGWKLRLTSIGNNSWQLFITKTDDTTDYVRLVYGVTEQLGGATRKFRILQNYIISPETNDDPAFLYQFEEITMKNRRVWVAFETVKRIKGKRGTAIGAYIALSPVQSKWRTSIGSTTTFEVKHLDSEYFKQLYANDEKLSQELYELLEQ